MNTTLRTSISVICASSVNAGPVLAAVDECLCPGIDVCRLAPPEPRHGLERQRGRLPTNTAQYYLGTGTGSGSGTGTNSDPLPREQPWLPFWDNDHETHQVVQINARQQRLNSAEFSRLMGTQIDASAWD